MDERLLKLRELTENLMKLEEEKLATMHKLYRAIEIEEFRKKNESVQQAKVISWLVKGDRLRTYLITTDSKEILKFQDILYRHFHKHKKDYPDLTMNTVNFESKKTVLADLC